MYVVWKHTRHFYCKLLLLSMKYWAATSSLTFGIVYCFSFLFFTIHSSFYARDRRLSTVYRNKRTCRYMILFMLNRKHQHWLQYHTLGNLKFDYRVEDLSEETAKCTLMLAFFFFLLLRPIYLCEHSKISQNN